MLMLYRSIRDFEALKEYLIFQKRVPDKFFAFYLEQDDAKERDNEDDPRAMCYVVRGQYKIACSSSLEALPAAVRIGVLLHELGHHAVDGFKSEDDEVDVDAWVVRNVPEASYTYLPKVEYIQPLTGKKVEARNLQTVGDAFVELIHGE